MAVDLRGREQQGEKGQVECVCLGLVHRSVFVGAIRRFSVGGLRISGKEIDLRVSTLPTVYGEGIVIRILEKRRR